VGVYERCVLPHLLDWGCGMKDVQKQRQKVVPLARGRVLEVGFGSARNLPFYDAEQVELVWGLEPSEAMRNKGRKRVEHAPFEVRWLDLPSEEIPLEDASADTVLVTYTLCTIDDWRKALAEMRRVLKPDGELVFCEHGLAPDPSVQSWQRRVNPLWRKMAGGCNLDRPIPKMLEEGGFQIDSIDSDYVSSPRFVAYEYWGSAQKA
jgi:ubiquinone/menaquinone biosynthesis C-methylase UbiE